MLEDAHTQVPVGDRYSGQVRSVGYQQTPGFPCVPLSLPTQSQPPQINIFTEHGPLNPESDPGLPEHFLLSNLDQVLKPLKAFIFIQGPSED